MSKTAAEVLRVARELVARPGGWCQRALARTASGHPAPTHSREAVCFCARGALMRAAGMQPELVLFSPRAEAALDAAAREQGFIGFVGYNDAPGRTQAEVVALYDAAIAKLEASR